jgi:hypothetical protein
MRNSIIYILAASALVLTCKNFDSADPSPRNTFLKFHEGPYSITATAMEAIPDGYIIVGNMIVDDAVNDTIYVETVIIKTDDRGNRTQEIARIAGSTAKAIKPIISGGSVTGYVVVGDSIKIDPLEEQVANVSISSLRGLLLNNQLQLIDAFRVSDTSSTSLIKQDFTGEAVEITEDGRIIVLGTSKRAIPAQQAAPAEPFVIAFNSNFTLDWFKRYDLIDRTSQNSRSIHYSNGKIIWATAIADVAGDFVNSWVGIPIIDENSIYPNFSVIGQNTNTDQLFVPKDIQPASSPSFGYGVIGTYSDDQEGAKGNIFFLRVDINGNIIPGSDKYFDASLLAENNKALTNRDESFVTDDGEAITSTQDGGFVLAGTVTANSNKNVLLIKVNASGDMVWFKNMGGAGNEVPVTIRETATGDLVICGTNTLGNYSTVFLMKTDKNGELTN